MQQMVAGQEGLMPESVVTSRVGVLRLAVGLLQGLALYLLYFAAKSTAWPATDHFLFAPLLLACLIAPVLLMSSLGHLPGKTILIWMLAAVVIIAGLGLYDVWRGDTASMMLARGEDGVRIRYPSPLLFVFLLAGFFIAHSLLLSAAHDHRRIARYATHFEIAWKLIIQLAFSALFIGVLWGALWLGAALFMLVKLDFLRDLLQKSWFAIPVTAFGFACAMHITDVRPAIVRGIRSLLLVLLSWILPVTTLIVVAFLMSLPLTGLQPLWATKSATAVLLGAAATLVVLINAAFQNGEVASSVARIVRLSVRLAALALLPIVAIAIYSLGLRVHEYGWTTDRIIAASCLLVASCYAAGYAWAAFRKADWMRSIAPTNVATAYLVLVVLVALFSPAADPARISVNNQLARLQAGLTNVAEFDFEYLRFEGARYGQSALEQLTNQTHGTDAATIREKAQRALAQKHPSRRHDVNASATEIAANITVWPQSEQMPASFAAQNWSAYARPWELPACLRQANKACDAFLLDMDADGKMEILLLPTEPFIAGALMAENADGGWSKLGELPRELSGCQSLRKKLIAGEYQLVTPRMKDLELGGHRFEIQRQPAVREVKCAPMSN